MEYVSKEVVLAAIEDAMKTDNEDERFLAGWKKALWQLKTDVEAMEPATSDDVATAALSFRQPMAPVLKNNQVYVCGMCGHKVNLKHSFCKRCGQAILKKKGEDCNQSNM